MSGHRGAVNITPSRTNAPGRWGVMDVYHWRRLNRWPVVPIDIAVGDIWAGNTYQQLDRIDRDGARVFHRGSSLFDNAVVAVEVDANENAYTASAEGIRKVGPTGSGLWLYNNGIDGRPSDVAVDGNGYSYTGDWNGHVHRINPNGQRDERFENLTQDSTSVRAIAVDADGSIYIGGSGKTVFKYDSTGELVWTMGRHSDSVHALAVDGDGNVYSASGGNDRAVRKTDGNGDHEWTYTDFEQSPMDVAVDADGFVYVASWEGSVHKLNRHGTRQWRNTRHQGSVHGVAVDAEGFVYSAGWDATVRCMDRDGKQQWVFAAYSSGSTINSVAVGPGVHGAGHGW